MPARAAVVCQPANEGLALLFSSGSATYWKWINLPKDCPEPLMT
jgi:hypothetical protein